MILERLSEKTGPLGGITAEGMINVLGCPPFDRLTLVLREAAQNAWDARTRGSGDDAVPELRVRIRTLTLTQANAFRQLFSDQGSEPAARNEFAQNLSLTRAIRVLEICDFGTVGLRGPVDPRQPLDGQSSNFRNFFFDLGVAHPTSGDGGTYGYGRSSLYLASGARTILVDSLAVEPGGMERRFMACRIGHAYERRSFLGAGTRHTGRHFWGRKDDESIFPVTDAAAATISSSLGMPARGTTDSGTSILIPWPEADADGVRGSALVEVLLCHLWPKMVSQKGPRAMRFAVEDEGRSVQIPRVTTHPVYGLFAAALLAARDRSGASGAREIRLQKPDIVTGHLGLEVGAEIMPVGPDRDEADTSRFQSPVETGAHHVALMRPSELVVRYLEVPSARVDARAWAGVFLCATDSTVQNAFARSEPPAHDDWLPDRLEDKHHRRLVNRTIKHLIPLAVRDAFGAVRSAAAEEGGGSSLAAAADAFSRGFLTGNGTSASPQTRAGSGGKTGPGSRSRPRLSGPLLDGLRFENGLRIATYRVGLAGTFKRGVTLVASASVASDNTQGNADIPAGVTPPEVLGWRDPDGASRAIGAAIRIDRECDVLVDVAFRGHYGLSMLCTLTED
jgi:hypothetical protein